MPQASFREKARDAINYVAGRLGIASAQVVAFKLSYEPLSQDTSEVEYKTTPSRLY